MIRDFSTIADWSDTTGSRNFKNIGSMLRLSAIISESMRGNKAEDSTSIWVPVKRSRHW
ncbi:hypothetical protein [Paraflavitalea speifideaquila]|uniref:hypothetical protein n=1 Tax=Paraflavitalea speifideaquila TaxID=3076558 RepID=UPI0028E8FB92|nr:hypothetical protein [Paraflavitalea speifideiaquila]